MESLRVFLAQNVFSTLQGMLWRDWKQTLSENRYSISPFFLLRALLVTISSPVNSRFATKVEQQFGERIESTKVNAPVFILGHWRSGTTYLQRLLAEDNRYAWPSFYQVIFPRGFLISEEKNAEKYSKWLPQNRIFDNMSNDFHAPAEDEFALCTMTGLSPYMGWCFPKRQEAYDKYLTFDQATDAEKRLWKDALADFIRRLTVRFEKPLILKSPTHTCRTDMILEMFPDARFVHIHRNPYTVYLSTKKMLSTFFRSTQFQRFDPSVLDDRILAQYRSMHESFFQQRERIPDGQYFEIAFDDLEANPMQTMQQIYETLSLPDFAAIQPKVQAHIDAQKGYKKNKYPELPDEIRNRINQEWSIAFDGWNYERV